MKRGGASLSPGRFPNADSLPPNDRKPVPESSSEKSLPAYSMMAWRMLLDVVAFFTTTPDQSPGWGLSSWEVRSTGAVPVPSTTREPGSSWLNPPTYSPAPRAKRTTTPASKVSEGLLAPPTTRPWPSTWGLSAACHVSCAVMSSVWRVPLTVSGVSPCLLTPSPLAFTRRRTSPLARARTPPAASTRARRPSLVLQVGSESSTVWPCASRALAEHRVVLVTSRVVESQRTTRASIRASGSGLSPLPPHAERTHSEQRARGRITSLLLMRRELLEQGNPGTADGPRGRSGR